MERPVIFQAMPGTTKIFLLGEQKGVIYIYSQDGGQSNQDGRQLNQDGFDLNQDGRRMLLDISNHVYFNVTSQYGGLISLALHPQYQNNGLLYTYSYTSETTACVLEYKIKQRPLKVELKSERFIFQHDVQLDQHFQTDVSDSS